jgi:hypothetical protein
MGIILAPIALILFILVFIIETFFSLFFETKKRKWFTLISSRLYRKAKLIDIFGNYLFPEFWNFIFSKKGDNYSYGRLGETLSSATGKKKLENSLTKTGLILYYILYIIDFPSWKYGGHCIRYIMSEEQIKNFK